MKKLIFLFLLLPFIGKAQVYQSMPQYGYGPVQRMAFDSALTLPKGLGTVRTNNAKYDTAQIRYYKTDSSIYIYTGYQWQKIGSNGADSSIFYTKFRSDTSRSNIYNQIATKGNGTVTSITANYGLLGGTITSSGSISVDTATLSNVYVRSGSAASLKSLSLTGTSGTGHLTLRHQSSDATAGGQQSTLFADANGYLKYKNDNLYYATLAMYQTADRIYTFQNKSYTLADSALVADTLSAHNTRIGAVTVSNALKLNISDSTIYQPKFRSDTMRTSVYTQLATKGTVNSVATGYGLSGGTITNTGTIIVDSATLSGKYLRRLDSVGTAGYTTLFDYNKGKDSLLSLIPAAGWGLNGNSSTSANFIGSTSNTSFRIYTNNTHRMVVDSTGNIGVGTTTPSASALLEMSSTSKGLVIPSMTKTQRDAIGSPAQGLLIWNTTLKSVDMYATIGVNSYWTTFGNGCKYGVAIGNNAMNAYTGTGDAYNVAIGFGSLQSATSAVQNTSIGGYSLSSTTGNQNTAVGYSAGSAISTGTNNAAFGLSAAQYLTTESNRLVINSIGRSNKAGDTTQSLIYGYQNTTVNNNQYLKVNGSLVVNSSGSAVGRPDNSAIVDLSSNTTKGFLPPKMTATQGSAIASPAEGLMIYVTDTNGTFTAKGWWGYDGTNWQKLNN